MASAISWFPSGKHFTPTDGELLVYLLNFITGGLYPCEASIPVVDLYGEKEPWELFSEHSPSSSNGEKKRDLYFITQLKEKSKNKKKESDKKAGKKKFSRLIGGGCWHGQDVGKQISYNNGALHGFKKSMVYQNRDSVQDRQWLLKEYSLTEVVIEHIGKKNPFVSERRDYVLCRMRLKKPKKNKKEELGETNNIIGDLCEDLLTKFEYKTPSVSLPPAPILIESPSPVLIESPLPAAIFPEPESNYVVMHSITEQCFLSYDIINDWRDCISF